jgi:hypothetical protein
VIDIEEGALRAFEEDALTVFGQVAQDLRNVCRDWRNVLCRLQCIFQRLCKIDRFRAEVILQQEVVIVEDLTEPGRKFLAQEQVRDPQGSPGDLVFVSRADAPPRGPDRAGAPCFLPRGVECDVRRQYQRAAGADLEPFEYRHAGGHQCLCFGNERVQGENDAIADQAAHPIAQDTGRNQVQDRLLAVDDQCMPGVVPPLKTHDGRGAIGEQIDDFSLALITPLGANDDDILTHYGLDSILSVNQLRTTNSSTTPAIMMTSPTVRR